MLRSPSRRGLITGAAALAAFAGLPRQGEAFPRHGAPSAGVTPTTLDPAHNAGILSNGNLTLEGVGGFVSARSIASASTGKYYVEATRTATAGGSPALALGVCTANASMSGFLIGLPDAAGVQDSDNTITEDGGSVGHIQFGWTTLGAGIGMAFDVDARLLWMRNFTGQWNASPTGNPATGVGGIALSTADLASMPLFVFASASQFPTDQITVNFGATGFADTPPAGFGILH